MCPTLWSRLRRPGYVTGCVLLLAVVATAAPLRFDFGTNDSQVWTGFTRATPANVWASDAAFGWRSAAGLSAKVRAYTAPVHDARRGSDQPPPMWTNPITEDAIVGTAENAFLLRAPPGEYQLYVVCGTSDPSMRSQFFDFTVQVGGEQQRVQIDGPYQFRTLRFRAKVGNEPLAVTFSPRSKWAVNAIVAWTGADAKEVETGIITPFEEWTFRLPPVEWAKWQLEAEPPTGPTPTPSAADQKRGFVVYGRHYLECVYPHSRPREEELNPELKLFASPGEHATTAVTVLPLVDIAGAKVAVSALGPVPAKEIDVRHVRFMRARPNYTTLYRYRWVPDVLERFEQLELKAGENGRFWITIRVPDDAPAGNYRGTVTFTCSTGTASIPVQLRILPIRLRDDPEKIFGIYYRHPYDQMGAAPDEVSKEYFRRKADREHADMVAHGTRNVVLSVSARPADATGKFSFNWELLAAKLELGKKHGFVAPVVLGVPTESIYEKHVGERPGSHLRGVKPPPPAFAAEVTAMVRAIEAERVRRGWPEFLYYPIDEPGTDAASISFMVTVLKACKAAGIRTYVTADPTREQFQPLRPHIDVWSTQPFAPEREVVLADSKARGVEYWCYPNHVNGENDHTPVAGARMTYGFGFWRSGFRTLIPWIYQSSTGNPFNYLDGASMDFFNRSEPDGTPVPVAMWEGYRAGYNDYRYVYTLEQLIAEAKRSGKPAAQEAAKAAEQELRNVWNAIRVQPKYKYDDLWSPEEFDVYRWLVARQILAIQSALGR
ncbi:MAG: hypothetical protein Q7S40_21680 [Opitutaceae bacterium]|nr:hypothetical protein [Opitutaceae bacterium]